MLKTIWNWIVGKERKVEHILADFVSKVVELEQHALDKTVAAYNHEQDAAVSTLKAAEAKAEAIKAGEVASKINALIS